METRRSYYPMHVIMGIFTFFTANFTIMTGIAEKNYKLKCWYEDSALLFPDKLLLVDFRLTS